MQTLRICFVAPNIYPLLDDSDTPFIGGAELQQALVGRVLRENGHEVSYITKKARRGDPDHQSLHGFAVHRTYFEEEGYPCLRFVYPRMIKLWRALLTSRSDIYYKRGPRYAGFVAFFCLLRRKKFIFAGANNWNFQKTTYFNQQSLWGWMIDAFDKWGIRKAQVVLVQSDTQKRLLAENFNREGVQVNNIFEKRRLSNYKPFVLWVANIKEQKRPFDYLEMARMLPDVRFKMIGGEVGGQESLYRELEKQAAQIPNLEFLGFRALEETEAVFNDASVFVNTSAQDMEGFPNTFLQAWSRGIPVVSFFDIDGLIASHGLGFVVSDLRQSRQAIWRSLALSADEKTRIQKYFNANHLPETYLNKLLALFAEQPASGWTQEIENEV